MRHKTKLLTLGTLGALGALGAAGYGVARAVRRRKAASSDIDSLFDSSDLDEPVIVTEEVVVLTEPLPGESDVVLELIPDLTPPSR